jgi:hypothetical protein
MPGRQRYADNWEDDRSAGGGRGLPYGHDYDDGGYADEYDTPDDAYGEEEERGLVLRQDDSLVGVSSTITQHGTPLLSYTRTMNRFYSNRKQRLSLGRHRCEVCGDRIRFWSFETPDGTHTHDGCYERLAWTWTALYAQQQRLATEGNLE